MDEKNVRSGEEVERQKKNQTSIDSAACVDEKKHLESHAVDTHTDRLCRKSIGKLWRAQNECDGMGRVSLLIPILVISLGSDAMPTTYKCIFYLSDLQFKEVRSLRLMKNYWQRKHVVVAHRFSRHRRRLSDVFFFFSSFFFRFFCVLFQNETFHKVLLAEWNLCKLSLCVR